MVLKLDESKFMDVKGFSFMDFSEVEKERDVSEFKMPELQLANKTIGVTSETIRQERSSASRSSFNVSPIVKKYRGLAKQEQEDFEKKIAEEVEKRFQDVKEKAFKEGYEEGKKEGQVKISTELSEDANQKMAYLAQVIEEVKQFQEQMLKERLQDTYELINTLTKWIILRELKNDGEYIKRLLEKLLLELKTRSNILVKVDRETFSKMPEALSTVQETLGKLENVRVEIDHDLSGGGMVIESANGIIDGSMMAQFEHLNKLFETVLDHE